jgi:hypothetical protein
MRPTPEALLGNPFINRCSTEDQCYQDLAMMNVAIEGVTQSCVADKNGCYYVHSTRIPVAKEKFVVMKKMSPSSAISKVNAAIHNHLAAPGSGEPSGPVSGEPSGPGSGEPSGPGSGEPSGPVSGESSGPVSGEPSGKPATATIHVHHRNQGKTAVPQNPNIPGVSRDTRMGLMNTSGRMGIPGVMLPGMSGSPDSTSSLSKNAPMIILVVLVGLLVWYLMNRNNQKTAAKEPPAPTVASLSAPVYYPPQPQTYYAPPSYAPQPQMWYPPLYQQAYPQPSAYPPMIARG